MNVINDEDNVDDDITLQELNKKLCESINDLQKKKIDTKIELPMIYILKIIEKIKDMKMLTLTFDEIKTKYKLKFTTLDNFNILSHIQLIMIKFRDDAYCKNDRSVLVIDEWKKYINVFNGCISKIQNQIDNKEFFDNFDLLFHLIYYKGLHILDNFDANDPKYDENELMELAFAYNYLINKICKIDDYIISEMIPIVNIKRCNITDKITTVTTKFKEIHSLICKYTDYIIYTKRTFQMYYIPYYIYELHLWKARNSYIIKKSLKYAPEYENECFLKDTYNSVYEHITYLQIIKYTTDLINDHKYNFETVLVMLNDFCYYFEYIKKIANFKDKYVHFLLSELKEQKNFGSQIPRIINLDDFSYFAIMYKRIFYTGDIYTIFAMWFEYIKKDFLNCINGVDISEITKIF